MGNKNQKTNKNQTIYRYYNFGGALGVVGVSLANIKHQDGEHTFLTGRQPEYQWIITADLHDTYEEAESSNIARFYKGVTEIV